MAGVMYYVRISCSVRVIAYASNRQINLRQLYQMVGGAAPQRVGQVAAKERLKGQTFQFVCMNYRFFHIVEGQIAVTSNGG